VVVDMHSDDRTVEIALEFGAKVHQHERLGFADPARAFALNQTTGSWILILDADEVVPVALAKRLVALAEQDGCDVVSIPRLNYLLGAPLRHTGWGFESDYQSRFFRRGSLVVSAAIHDFLKPIPGARVHRLPAEEELAIVHFNYLDVNHFLEKLNRYTTIEAEQAAARQGQRSPLASVWEAAREFSRRYVMHHGYRDGWRGFYLSAFMAFYRLSTAAKLAELKGGLGRGEAAKRYAEIAEQVIAQYGPSAPHPRHEIVRDAEG
jgi:glycosyltransferase involved in cell wall biosynthesis